LTAARRIAVATGSRAEFGLLAPVMRAIADHPQLDIAVLVAGTHLLGPEPTVTEVEASFDIAGRIPMQEPGETSRTRDAEALGRGVSGFASWIGRNTVDCMLVLGDRIEAFAAAAAASVAGIRVVHMHGGDRAPGIADEAMRHAITKLSHIHLPATQLSAQRIIAMGELPARVHVVGSPAVDGLDAISALDDEAFDALGTPDIVVLQHPLGRPVDHEQAVASGVFEACRRAGRVLAMHPNHDPGREGIVAAIDGAGLDGCRHLPRHEFVGLLRRVRLLVGNSSAGLIECAALGVPSVNIGPRQDGRERPDNVLDVPDPGPDDFHAVQAAIATALAGPSAPARHPFGDGDAGLRTAEVLAGFDPRTHPLTKKTMP
jgi:UDP-hydrolysing UDP-N-acetyl-D-glucosamine 2-epimerase